MTLRGRRRAGRPRWCAGPRPAVGAWQHPGGQEVLQVGQVPRLDPRPRGHLDDGEPQFRASRCQPLAEVAGIRLHRPVPPPVILPLRSRPVPVARSSRSPQFSLVCTRQPAEPEWPGKRGFRPCLLGTRCPWPPAGQDRCAGWTAWRAVSPISVPQAQARVASPSMTPFCPSTRKLSGGTSRRQPPRASSRAIRGWRGR